MEGRSLKRRGSIAPEKRGGRCPSATRLRLGVRRCSDALSSSADLRDGRVPQFHTPMRRKLKVVSGLITSPFISSKG
jgi:hypothetical protein